jgi:hypothetical protein
MSSSHTFGSTCLLYRPPISSDQKHSDTPPILKAQFFYTSPLSIDDLLSPLPPPSSGSGTADPKHPPRPFSAYDNAALEEAWKSLEHYKNKHHKKNKDYKSENLKIVREEDRNHLIKSVENDANESTVEQDEEPNELPTLTRPEQSGGLELGDEMSETNIPGIERFKDDMDIVGIRKGDEEFKKEHHSVAPKFQKGKETDSPPTNSRDIKTPESKPEVDTRYVASLPKSDITGTPFLRAPDRVGRSPVPKPSGLDSVGHSDRPGPLGLKSIALQQSDSPSGNSSPSPAPKGRGIHHSEETDYDTEDESCNCSGSGTIGQPDSAATAATTALQHVHGCNARRKARERSYVPGRLVYTLRRMLLCLTVLSGNCSVTSS